MRRPTALRRLRARVFDRRMAAGGFSIAALAVLGAAGIARAPTPKVAAQTSDPQAARSLVALMRSGEHGSWLVRYEFTRTLADGRALRQPMSEARHRSTHALVSGETMTVERGGRVFDCNLVDGRASCHRSTRGAVVPSSQVLQIAVSAGAYAVVREPSVTVAGVPARCFRVVGTGRGLLPDIGTQTDACLSAEGVPLRQRVVRPSGDIDERVARSMKLRVSTRTVEGLERSFGPGVALGQP